MAVLSLVGFHNRVFSVARNGFWCEGVITKGDVSDHEFAESISRAVDCLEGGKFFDFTEDSETGELVVDEWAQQNKTHTGPRSMPCWPRPPNSRRCGSTRRSPAA